MKLKEPRKLPVSSPSSAPRGQSLIRGFCPAVNSVLGSKGEEVSQGADGINDGKDRDGARRVKTGPLGLAMWRHSCPNKSEFGGWVGLGSFFLHSFLFA